MHMNAYVERVIESVRQKHGNEPEFVQTVEEVLSSLSPVIDKHPEYEKADLLGRIVSIGECRCQFRVQRIRHQCCTDLSVRGQNV